MTQAKLMNTMCDCAEQIARDYRHSCAARQEFFRAVAAAAHEHLGAAHTETARDMREIGLWMMVNAEAVAVMETETRAAL